MKKPNIGYYFRTKIIISETLKNDTSFPYFVEKKTLSFELNKPWFQQNSRQFRSISLWLIDLWKMCIFLFSLVRRKGRFTLKFDFNCKPYQIAWEWFNTTLIFAIMAQIVKSSTKIHKQTNFLHHTY